MASHGNGMAWASLGEIIMWGDSFCAGMYVCVGGQVKSGQVVFKDPEFDRVENGTVDCR